MCLPPAGESIVESTRNLEKDERVEHTEKKRKEKKEKARDKKEASCRRWSDPVAATMHRRPRSTDRLAPKKESGRPQAAGAETEMLWMIR